MLNTDAFLLKKKSSWEENIQFQFNYVYTTDTEQKVRRLSFEIKKWRKYKKTEIKKQNKTTTTKIEEKEEKRYLSVFVILFPRFH